MRGRICLHSAYTLHRDNHRLAGLPSCVTPSLAYTSSGPRSRHRPEGSDGSGSITGSHGRSSRYGNINPLSIDYACRPRLRSRLTLGGLAWPRNPWSFGGRVSHSAFATHACILTRVALHAGSPRRLHRHTTLPYPSTHLDDQVQQNATASAECLSPATLSAQDPLDQ